MKKSVLFVSLYFLTLIRSSFAHGDEFQTSLGNILPFKYFQSGDIFTGLLVIGFWFIILKGIYTLGFRILGRVIINEK